MSVEEKIETGIATVISVMGALLILETWRDVLAAFIISLFSFMGCIGILAFRQQLRKRVVVTSAIIFFSLGLASLILTLIDQVSLQR